MKRLALCVLVVGGIGCGSAKPAPAPAADPQVSAAEARRAETARRAKLSAAHRALEAEQSEALAQTCERGGPAKPRCEPSCYSPGPADPRQGTKFPKAEIKHLVCGASEAGPYVLLDEFLPAPGIAAAKRFPRPGRPDAVTEAVARSLGPEVARGDVIQITGRWAAITHPVTKESLRCITVSHFTKLAKPLDACGSRGKVACEASGNAAAHGLDVVHYRLAEARTLEARGDLVSCQRAALEAIAVAHGMPRWRQYMTLNVATWTPFPRYRTRFDGLLDEEALFTTAATLGAAAATQWSQCGGATVKTTVAQEQSFHTCW